MSEDSENKVTCSAEDSENVRQYSKHFNVALTPELDAALDAFEKEPTYENQKEFKLQISKWMLETDHESFKDDLWNAPKKAAEDAVFDLQFDKDVKEEFTVDSEESES